MNSVAVNHHDGDDDALCVLAVEPDASQAASLEQALEGRVPGRLMIVDSTEAALKVLVDAIPDLVLVSPLLPPRTEEKFLEHLRVLGVDASHLQLLSIPRFNDDAKPSEKKRFGPFNLKKGSSTGDSVASAFAGEVAECLARIADQRTDRLFESFSPESPSAAAADPEAGGVRLEHFERLLERLQPEDEDVPVQVPVEAPAAIKPAKAEATVPQTSRKELENAMPMPTAQDFAGSDVDSARLPRFLTLDQQIPSHLRSVLDEADGCLRMAFLTGGGACATRALDVLLSDQGIGENDRAHQLRELGKKHPAVAESFLRILLQVMNDASAIWDISRLTLAIVLLKAVAHEIYVLGPERTERAQYVLGLLERFNAGSKGGGTAA
jgi:hypothetical protein